MYLYPTVFSRYHGKAYLDVLSENVAGPAEDVGGSTAGVGRPAEDVGGLAADMGGSGSPISSSLSCSSATTSLFTFIHSYLLILCRTIFAYRHRTGYYCSRGYHRPRPPTQDRRSPRRRWGPGSAHSSLETV